MAKTLHITLPDGSQRDYPDGTTGLQVSQTDTYVVGQESYRTDTQISNTGGSSQSVILYRAADCYLGGSDTGYGFVVASTAAVAAPMRFKDTPRTGEHEGIMCHRRGTAPA